MAGGEMLGALRGQARLPDEVQKQELQDMRTQPFEETAGYMFNGSIAQSRYQQYFPIQAVGSTNTITFDLAPTGSPADLYDFYNSWFAMDWTWSYDHTGQLSNNYASTFSLFHSLCLFQTVRLFVNGVEINDESNNYQHIADFHKLIFTEPWTPLPVQLYNTSFATNTTRQFLSTGICTPPFLMMNSTYDDAASTTRVLYAWLQETAGAAFLDATGGTPQSSGQIQTTYRPYQSFFRCKDFIPCSARIRMEFTKFSADWSFATCQLNGAFGAGGADGAISNRFLPVLDQMTLYGRVVTLTNQTLQQAATQAMSLPYVYPMMRANTTVFPVPAGTSTLNIQVTGQRRPQVCVLHLVPATVVSAAVRTLNAVGTSTAGSKGVLSQFITLQITMLTALAPKNLWHESNQISTCGVVRTVSPCNLIARETQLQTTESTAVALVARPNWRHVSILLCASNFRTEMTPVCSHSSRASTSRCPSGQACGFSTWRPLEKPFGTAALSKRWPSLAQSTSWHSLKQWSEAHLVCQLTAVSLSPHSPMRSGPTTPWEAA